MTEATEDRDYKIAPTGEGCIYGPRWSHRQQAGFTLLELVIAITLLGIMMTLAYGALRVGNRSWSAVAGVHQASDELRVGYRFLRRQLGQALSPRTEADEQSAPVFEGDAGRLTFDAPLPVRAGGSGGLYRFTLGFDEATETRGLVLNYGVYSREQDDGAEADQVILADNMPAGRFSYYGAADEGDEAAWHAAWDRTDALPRLVKLGTGDEARDDWPELVFPVRNSRDR